MSSCFATTHLLALLPNGRGADVCEFAAASDGPRGEDKRQLDT